MNSNGIIVIIIVIILALGGIFWWYHSSEYVPPVDTGTQASSTTTLFDQSISDGTIKISYPSADFGLAVNKTQILVTSYIPPCDDNFNYCLYYKGSAYAGTNFESAGIRIDKRTDLSTERTCLNTPPAGFDATMMPTATSSSDTYSTSYFSQVGDAGAGHVASGSLYRVYYRATPTCYEFETRIGETQFANYPEGSIDEFTDADKATVQSLLQSVLKAITLPSGEAIQFLSA